MTSSCISEKYTGCLEQVYAFHGAMPTGVSVSETGRIFVCFPQWGDQVKAAVCEICSNKLIPYHPIGITPSNSFLSVQSIVADGTGILWILDTGAPNFSVPDLKMARLISVDLCTNSILRIYHFNPKIVLPTTYLNDVRIA